MADLFDDPAFDGDNLPPEWPADDPGPPEPPSDELGRRRARRSLEALLLNRSALRALPDPMPLIDGTLDQGTNALVYGPWGTGKSFIAQDFAASVATGRTWQGRLTVQRRTLYVIGEGAFGLDGRLNAWEAGWHTAIGDDGLDVLPRAVNLTNVGQVAELAALIADRGYGFVVFDTLARCMVGADENSAKDCGVVVDSLTRLRECTPGGRGVVLGVHHSGKDGRTFRGSSVFEAAADTVYAVTRDAESTAIMLTREKRKDGPVRDVHRLILDPIEGTGSCVVGVSPPLRHEHRSDALLSHFKSHFADTGATPTQLRDTIDLNRATFYRALNDLAKSGALLNTGTDKRPFYKLADK